MSASLPSLPPGGFPKARQGYARQVVDDHVAQLRRRIESLESERAGLLRERESLAASLAELRSQYERLRTADLDERSRDILARAEEEAGHLVREGQRTAADIVGSAEREAEVLLERGRQELAWGRRQLAAERAEWCRQQPVPHPPTDADAESGPLAGSAASVASQPA